MSAGKHEDLGGSISGQVIGAAMAVHREWGPGLEEADYERALHLELLARGLDHQCQAPLPLLYKGVSVDCGYRTDVVLPGRLLVELKAVDQCHPLYEAQLLTYLRLSEIGLGLLINFRVLMLRDGILRRANGLKSPHKMTERPIDDAGMDGPHDPISREVVDAVVEAHRHLGTGLLRSAYQACLLRELKLRGLRVECDLAANLTYREELIPSGKQIPMVVEDCLMVSCHCVTQLGELLLARDRSLLRASHVDRCLCINFHGATLKGGICEIRRRFQAENTGE